MSIRRISIALCLALLCRPAAAGVDDYFQGKSISLFAGFTPGGGVDDEMRLNAQFLGAHIAGNPGVVPLNMPGAGGILLANHMYAIDKPDGLTIGMPGRSGFVLAATTGDPAAHYELSGFTWIGGSGAQNPILWLRKSLGVRTYEQLEDVGAPLALGALAGTSSSALVPRILAKYEGLKFKIISGYTGLSEVVLAMERGELDGLYTEASTFPADLIASGAVVPIFQTFNLNKTLPSLERLVINPRERGVLELVIGPSRIGAPVVAPPGLPGPVAKILRDAYLGMENDPAFREQAKKRGVALGSPSSGAELQSYVSANFERIEPDVLAEYRALVAQH